MKNYSKCMLTGVLLVISPLMICADSDMGLVLSGGNATIDYQTEAGRYFEIWTTTNLTSAWTGPVDGRVGSGAKETVVLPLTSASTCFYQLRIRDLALTNEEFSSRMVGNFIPNTSYYFTSSTRFSWQGETGSWSYSKTGQDTAILIFTYDEANNNPAIYREEIRLTFTTRYSGTYDFYEYYSNVINASALNQPFDLD